MSAGPQKTSAESLTTPVQYLKGVGPKRAELLARLELKTARDVLFFFPRDYQDMSELRSIDRLEPNQPVSVCGVVEEIELRNTGPGKSTLGVLIRQDTQYLRAIWFNQTFIRDKLSRGARVLLSGTARQHGLRWEMAHPRVQVLASDEEPPAGRILPVYALTDGVSQPVMRRIVHSVVQSCSDGIEEVLPESFLAGHNLWPIRTALPQVHTPADRASLLAARRRFVYQELLTMQLALALRRSRLLRRSPAPPLRVDAKIDSRIRRLFPFELTGDQQQAILEISGDLARECPMNRLLQGDVGSGKTVVAEYAMLLAVAKGHQAVLMAPTEVLARQHVRTLSRDLRESRVRIGLLTGSLSTAQRRTTLAAITAGELDLVVGTHAVLHEDVDFPRLGLVVIDEQHKFGVRQRAALRSGFDPHYLVMTATPIPRTVSMTLFGDLDVSTLRQAPPGRQAVHTYLGDQRRRESWWDFFRKKLCEGRQAYVVTPLVEESAQMPLASVEQAYEELANGVLSEFRLDLVHGQLSAEEKEVAMQDFRSGATQVLVATSVVEVGVDVPNATLMTIESGEHFGLAQLHQLRGRISRGTYPGFVCVFARADTSEAQRRLDAFAKTTDGFELAELDFQLRGPGDLFGLRQHGMPRLRVADLQQDTELLQEARTDAQALITDDPDFAAPQFARLRQRVLARYGQALDLGDVG